MSRRFKRNGWPTGSEALLPVNIVASATPHTKGPWIDLDASVAEDIVGFWLASEVVIGVAATDTSMLIDIGIGVAAAETVVVANIPFGAHGETRPVFIPIHVRASERLAARNQGAVVSDIYDPVYVPVYGSRIPGWGGFSWSETIGVSTATSGPTTGDLTDSAWDEAVASTANPYRALTVHVCLPPADTNVTGADFILDVGIGAAAAEVVLASYYVDFNNNNEIIGCIVGPEFIERDIAAGSRLAIRKNGTLDFSAALIGWS